MSILDRVFFGRVIRDFGAISEVSLGLGNLGIGKQKVSLLLAERRGKNKLVFKMSSWTFVGAGVSYVEIPTESIPMLQHWLGEATNLIASGGHPA